MSFTVKATALQVNALKAHFNLSGTQVEAITPNTTPGKYQISDGRVHAVAQFNADAETLDVTIVKKPFYVFESHIRGGLEAELKTLEPAPKPPATPLPPKPVVPLAAKTEAPAPGPAPVGES